MHLGKKLGLFVFLPLQSQWDVWLPIDAKGICVLNDFSYTHNYVSR